MNIEHVTMDSLPCWVRIWNHLLGYVDTDFGKAVGAHIGEVMEVDRRSVDRERVDTSELKEDDIWGVSRINKFDSWMLVHREKRMYGKRRENTRDRNNRRGEEQGPWRDHDKNQLHNGEISNTYHHSRGSEWERQKENRNDWNFRHPVQEGYNISKRLDQFLSGTNSYQGVNCSGKQQLGVVIITDSEKGVGEEAETGSIGRGTKKGGANQGQEDGKRRSVGGRKVLGELNCGIVGKKRVVSYEKDGVITETKLG
ncbi:hypothetical protein LIER_39248 [Lithospermum erythrorhizon]|uniref:DUF4283 domain-containing protein n=1 Tax=Lithospermum erythrorhizon TaxID=34254 RepID=A0AAV3QBN0_LITER